MTPAVVWFRQDLRLQDNPALAAALARGGPVIPVYILDDAGEGRWKAGAASRWWLHHSLASLDASLRARGSRMILARGASLDILRALVKATDVGAVFWNRRYEPAVMARDHRIEAALGSAGIEVRTFNGALLLEPHAVTNKQGGPFQVFTPYWRHCLELPVEEPLRLGSAPFSAPRKWPRSLALGELGLLPRIRWDTGLAETWEPGEKGAAARLRRFVSREMGTYAADRDRPDLEGTSRLSPYVHHGELSPRQIWAAVKGLSKNSGIFPPHNGARVFLKEIGWREFAHHLLVHFPHTPEKPLRPEFGRFPWERKSRAVHLRAWQEGRTGYPIVDAAMRQLWHTGWMHNRMRMVVASFLVKHMRISWNEGAAWFWNTLVDADLANNTLGWQWTAGCGADAAPFFRIFSPLRQALRTDPDGAYVRRWVPELAALPTAQLHAPGEAPTSVLNAAGVSLGETYPQPLVDHAEARVAALKAFKRMRMFTRA